MKKKKKNVTQGRNVLGPLGPNSPSILDRSSVNEWQKSCLLRIKGCYNPSNRSPLLHFTPSPQRLSLPPPAMPPPLRSLFLSFPAAHGADPRQRHPHAAFPTLLALRFPMLLRPPWRRRCCSPGSPRRGRPAVLRPGHRRGRGRRAAT
jgi:hypothetical protein